MKLRRISDPGIDPSAASAPGSGVFGLPTTADDASAVLLPVPWDVTTSYRAGTAGGPALILEASKQVDLYDAELAQLGLPGPWRYGIHMLPVEDRIDALNLEARRLAEPVIAAGGATTPALEANLARVNALSAELNEWVYRETSRWLERGKLVGIVGGDHSVPFGAIRAYAERYTDLGILHIDAHADLRRAYEGFTHSHASIMDNVLNGIDSIHALTQVGIRDVCDEEIERIELDQRVMCFFDHELRARRFEGETWQSIAESVVMTLPSNVYVSFDIDGLDPSLCPNTGTPVPGGLFFPEVTYLLRTLLRTGKRIVGFDLVEVAGPADGSDAWDGNVGARMLYKMLGYAMLSQGAKG